MIEIIGYWFIDLKSREEALDWAMCEQDPHGLREGQIGLRQVSNRTQYYLNKDSIKENQNIYKASYYRYNP
ncbi:hypothetical protein [Radiobacillus sp. PE A8.2]|uniref:hypothetical protein n=1 Tax=Radiobacillus sp. PE A8.2 TaxID=3380349 RepID=UPI0038906F6E